MARNLSDFRNNFFGVRSNRFMVHFEFPAAVRQGLNLDEAQTIYCKATQTPATAIGIIPVLWQGRQVKFSGERVYGDWTVVIYESAGSKSSHNIKAGFERWIELMDRRNEHTINYNVTTNWEIYYDDMALRESRESSDGQNRNIYSKQIKMINCFPVEISPLDLAYEQENQFAEFTVTMSYDYWEPMNAATGL